MQIKVFSKLVIATPIIVTLFVTDQLLDPFNIGKFALLVTLSGLILLTLPRQLLSCISPTRIRLLILILGVFVLSQLFSILLNKQNIYRGLLGIWGRNNGLLFYFALSVLLITTYIYVINFGDSKLLYALSYLGLIEAFYGLMQWQNADIFKFAFIGSPVFLTLGNEDFSSLFLVITIITTLSLISSCKQDFKKILYFVSAVFQFVIMLEMNTAQSKLALGTSLLVYLLFNYRGYSERNKKHKIIVITLANLTVLASIAGLFGKGPLSFINYNLGSLNSRYLHWVAGWKMFTSKPLSGIGIDSYGDFQPFFRIADQNGVPDSYSNNAHNIIIQYLATGGILMTLSFLILLILLTLSLVKIIKNKLILQASKTLYTSIFLINLIHILIGIENVALAVWFWAFMGAIFAISDSSDKPTKALKFPKTAYTMGYRTAVIMPVCLGIMLVSLSFLPWRNVALESQLQNLFVETNSKGISDDLMNKIDKTAYKVQDPETRMLAIKFLYDARQNEFAFNLSNDLNAKFPRNLRALEAMFQYKIKSGDTETAIKLKKIQISLDPLNVQFKKDLEDIKILTD